MRFKPKQVFYAALVCLILFVSYKILEPEINGQSYKDEEKYELDKLNVRHHVETKDSFRSHKHDEFQKIDREDVIKELVKKYWVNYRYGIRESPWLIAKSWYRSREVHPEYAPELGAVLNSLATRKITAADVGYKGTQLKMLLTLEGNQKAAFKPKFFLRNHVIEGKPYAGEDRHNGEIAAFHLGRLLEFRRTPLAVGRVVDMEKDIAPVATELLKNTFFKRKNNTCFYGKCYYCKGKETGVCGNGTKLEGAIILWLPDVVLLKTEKHPWARSYKEGKLAKWQSDENYCNSTIMKNTKYSKGRELLDLVDMSILDYLISNADRHNYAKDKNINNSTVLIMDNAKSFGNPHIDERSILAPLYQCCRVRESTWMRLLVYQDGVLSTVMESILSQDPIAPVITNLHLKALDRRLMDILNIVETCILTFGIDPVLAKGR